MRKTLAFGLILGAFFGLWNFLASRLDPLAEDTIPALLGFYGPMFAAWGLAGSWASYRTGHLPDAVKVGAAVAFVSFVVLTLAVVIRINLDLDTMAGRPDWQNLIGRFRASGLESLRAFVNYEYATGAPFKLLVASTIGAVFGLVGGLFVYLGRRGMGRISPVVMG